MQIVKNGVLRTWTDLQGQTMEAVLFGADEELVYLRKPGEQAIIPVPRAVLSEGDRDFVASANPGPAPVKAPSVRVQAREKRGRSLDRQRSQTPRSYSDGSIEYSYRETRVAHSQLTIQVELSTMETCDVTVVYYTAYKGEDGWQLDNHSEAKAKLEAGAQLELESKDIQISPVKAYGENADIIAENRNNTEIRPDDWAVAVFWRDSFGRPVLLHMDASERAIILDDKARLILSQPWQKSE